MITPEYLDRNRAVATSYGLTAGLVAVRLCLAGQARAPKWLLVALDEAIARSEQLTRPLIEYRAEAAPKEAGMENVGLCASGGTTMADATASNPTVEAIVREYLTAHGYDGLWSDVIDNCACRAKDLFPCGGPNPDCRAGYEAPCDCGDHGYHICAAKRGFVCKRENEEVAMDAPRGTPPVTPIRRARRIRRLLITDAAADMGVSAETWRRWGRGINAPRFPEVVAKYLGITVDEVLTRPEENMSVASLAERLGTERL